MVEAFSRWRRAASDTWLKHYGPIFLFEGRISLNPGAGHEIMTRPHWPQRASSLLAMRFRLLSTTYPAPQPGHS